MLMFCIGERILVNGRLYVIKRICSFDVIEVQDVELGVWQTVARRDVRPPVAVDNAKKPLLCEVLTQHQQDIRDLRHEIVQPTLHRVCSKELISDCAEKAVQAGLLKKGNPSTIYDWKRKIERCGDSNALAPPLHPTGGRGQHRLDEEVEKLMMLVIDGSYLTPQKKKPTAVYWDLLDTFDRENQRRVQANLQLLPVPCQKTLFARIKGLNPQIAEERRYGKKSARERFGIMKGKLECGKWPWQLGQMDHKQLRNWVIDEVTGEPLGRPWLTAIVDTNSRVPPGFVLSLAKPSAVNIGLCLAMSMIQKDYWLKMWGLDQEDFPVFGKWVTVQADNELKNEADAIIEGCKRKGIVLEFRALRDPQGGAFIESLWELLDEELRNLPGYQSRIRKNNENYDAKNNATFTMKRLYKAIAVILIKKHCLRKHSGLNDSPLNVYKRNLMESGIGIPPMIFGDEARDLILHFMPFEERTIQEYGVRMFNSHYRSEALQEYIIQDKEVR